MEKIPTTEEFLESNHIEGSKNRVKIINKLIKLHVEAALKAAHRNMQLPEEDLEFTLNAYPLENIK
jgi:D-mannonate dehydratase